MLRPNTSFIGWMALVYCITFFVQKMTSLVEAIHFKLSGILSLWLRENIKCNIFLQPYNFEKIARLMPQVTAMLSHHCKLTLIPHTIQRDQMPMSKIFSASTSNAIFWTKKVIKHTSAIQPHKETVGCGSSWCRRWQTTFFVCRRLLSLPKRWAAFSTVLVCVHIRTFEWWMILFLQN